MIIKDLLLKDTINKYVNLDEINKEDLKKIKTLNINGERYSSYDLGELRYLIELEYLVLNNLTIDNDIIESLLLLSKLKSLTLNKCKVDSNKLGSLNIKELIINGCSIEYLYYINDITNLEILYLDNLDEVNLKLLNILGNLKEFSMGMTKVLNDEYLFYLSKVEKLRLDGTGLTDLSLCLSLDNLKYLVIDEKQVINNKDYLLELKDKGVMIVNYNNQEIKL